MDIGEKMKQYLVIATLGLLAGCGAAVNKTYLPSGEEGYAIDCSGPASELVECYEKAGNVCGARGYEIIRPGDIRLSNRAMLIKCK